MGVSVRPSDAAKGGSLEPGRYTFTEARYTRYKYPNSEQETGGLVATLIDAEGQARDQVWSWGSLEDFIPSDDEQEIVQAGRRDKLSESCNLVSFNASLVNHGYPEDRMTDKAGETYNGLVCVLVPQEHARKGKPNPNMPATVTVVECEEIIRLPWAKEGEGVGVSAPAAGGAAPAAGATGDAGDKLRAFVISIVPASGMNLPGLRTKVYQQFKDDPQREQMTKLLNDGDWLDSLSDDGIARDDSKLIKVG